MLTFEKVLAVFKDYLIEDKRYEILMSSHGYTVMEWDSKQQDWADAQFCSNPEKMKDILLDAFAGYLEYQTTHCTRPLTEAEKSDIQLSVQVLSSQL